MNRLGARVASLEKRFMPEIYRPPVIYTDAPQPVDKSPVDNFCVPDTPRPTTVYLDPGETALDAARALGLSETALSAAIARGRVTIIPAGDSHENR